MPRTLSPETRAKLSAARKAWLADPAHREQIRQRQLANQIKIQVNARLAEERIEQLVAEAEETPSEPSHASHAVYVIPTDSI